MKAAKPKSDPIVKTVLLILAGAIAIGVGVQVIGGMGQGSTATAVQGFQVTGTVRTRVEHGTGGAKTDLADLYGTVTNNTGRGCGQTAIVGTALDHNDAIQSVSVATKVATSPGQTASWKTTVPYNPASNTITHITWTALCDGN